MANKWLFWIDRGGTFTDIVALTPGQDILTHKLLSENPSHYQDAAIQGIRNIMKLADDEPIPSTQIDSVRMGTTVATNALLEHKGEPLLLLTTRGFRDALRIAYQQRPDLFALDIKLPQMLYAEVAEVDERLSCDGKVLQPLNIKAASAVLESAWQRGLRAVAIVLMHGYQYHRHESILAEIARQTGFTQISTSHETSPLIRLVSRGDTTVVDACLSPILSRYVNQVATQLPQTRLLFMQSNGGLTEAHHFHGKDAILSGPAGGVTGMVETAGKEGFDKLIGFDMGGTSTDVCHYAGELERSLETHIAGARICAPMMQIHTVAAGGGSILEYDGMRFKAGPDSAGAHPGPACYRNGGPLTITDCNVMLGKLRPEYFPSLFGLGGDQPLHLAIVEQHFFQLSAQVKKPPEQIAQGFLSVTVENMANAIKKISVQRGYDVSAYTLCCFGGAGAQHACLVADALGMQQIFLHRFSSVLSAYGMGLADIRKIRNQSVNLALQTSILPRIERMLEDLGQQAREELLEQSINPQHSLRIEYTLHCHYPGSDTTIAVHHADLPAMLEQFTRQHARLYGFSAQEQPVLVAGLQAEAISCQSYSGDLADSTSATAGTSPTPLSRHPVFFIDNWLETPFYARASLTPQHSVKGPAVILEDNGTVIIEPGWQASLTTQDNLVLKRYEKRVNPLKADTAADPVQLEIFNNLFMSIAEQMGYVLEKTAVSVNIKERLDFSCAIFDANGNLVANAPHMPVHLGSMSESIKAIIRANQDNMRDGDAWMLNAPYNGGTHLPDITVIRPVFRQGKIIFYVAARGHHADIGGATPGSIPPHSTNVDEEGVLIDDFKLMRDWRFLESEVRQLLLAGQYPVRNIDYNIADLKAQLASCEKGVAELIKMTGQYGLDMVQAYMQHVQDNAEESVRRVIEALKDGEFTYAMDDGYRIQVKIQVDHTLREAVIDFSGTSPQHPGNFNAPVAITRAAVLYVFRCLVDKPIPLNEGCLKPLKIILPEGCLLNPVYPAAVVAGNVETSQYVVDCLFGALGVMGAAQGTMNNVTWGNAQYQYYETICGGDGATANHDGADAVHTHMTNSRLTDPEILEQRFPVILEEFSIRSVSGGIGKHRGGNGVIRKTRFLQPMAINIVSGHRRIPPYGMSGGAHGKTGRNALLKAGGEMIELSSTATIQAHENDCLIIETPGGGGFGKAPNT